MRASARKFGWPILAALCLAWLAGGVTSAFADKPAFQPPAGWGPYLKTDKGETKPLQQPPEKNSDKDWMYLQFTDYVGPKNRLAIMTVQNKTADMEAAEKNKNSVVWTNHYAEVPVAAIEEMLTTGMFNSHRFRLTERKAIEGVLAEQDFGASGRVAQPSAAKIGKVLGAQFLVFTSVNEYTPEKGKTSAGGGGIGGGFLGGIGGSKSSAEVSMSFRIVDATTGEVMDSYTLKAEAGSWGLSFGGGGYGGGGAGGGAVGIERNSPIGYAVQSCINKAVYKICMKLKDMPWSGAVMKVAPGKIYVNAGSDMGLAVGMTLNAMSKGEELTDPETGMVLGSELTQFGSLSIVDVQEKYSVATISAGCKGIKVGDVLRLVK